MMLHHQNDSFIFLKMFRTSKRSEDPARKEKAGGYTEHTEMISTIARDHLDNEIIKLEAGSS